MSSRPGTVAPLRVASPTSSSPGRSPVRDGLAQAAPRKVRVHDVLPHDALPRGATGDGDERGLRT